MMTAEGMLYVLAFRVAKMCQKLRPFANSCNRIGKCTEFAENIPKYAQSCESRPKCEKILENAPKVENL